MRVLQAVLNPGKVTWAEAVCVCGHQHQQPQGKDGSCHQTLLDAVVRTAQTGTALEQRASAAASGCRNLFLSFSPQLSFQHRLVLLRRSGMDPVNPLAQPKECVGRTRPSFQGNGSCARYCDAEGGVVATRGQFKDKV